MSEVKIQISEKELREKFITHLTKFAETVSVAEMLNDAQFKHQIIHEHLKVAHGDPKFPVSIDIR